MKQEEKQERTRTRKENVQQCNMNKNNRKGEDNLIFSAYLYG